MSQTYLKITVTTSPRMVRSRDNARKVLFVQSKAAPGITVYMSNHPEPNPERCISIEHKEKFGRDILSPHDELYLWATADCNVLVVEDY